MTYIYHLAGQNISIPCPIPELQAFQTEGEAGSKTGHPGEYNPRFVTQTRGWVANRGRGVDIYETADGFLLNVEEGGEYIIASRGEYIYKKDAREALSNLDREIILGPVIVLALALRNVWSLHASAVMHIENAFAFMGESGQGKSTLAAYLSKQTGWQLVADDILPATAENDPQVLPRFPQLKMQNQPGADLPEQLPLKTLCMLERASENKSPALQQMSIAQTAHALLAHTAGTRMFNAELLEKHLKFATKTAEKVRAYKLIYPHRRETLPQVKELLETIC